MKSPLFLSALSAAAATSLLLISGCASVAETSNTASVENKCKVVMAQPARVNYDANKATDMDRAEARAKLAALELKRPPSRTSSVAGNNVIDQALRDCM